MNYRKLIVLFTLTVSVSSVAMAAILVTPKKGWVSAELPVPAESREVQELLQFLPQDTTFHWEVVSEDQIIFKHLLSRNGIVVHIERFPNSTDKVTNAGEGHEQKLFAVLSTDGVSPDENLTRHLKASYYAKAVRRIMK